jgi:Peptidase M10 serralysin C terminal/RTX calcium-binding nonapeptide repeat (4 copies)
MAYTYDDTNNISFSGDSWASPTSGSAVAGEAGTAPLTITADGLIHATNVTALRLDGGAYTVTNSGIITAENGSGLALLDGTATLISKISNTASGIMAGLWAPDCHGLEARHAITLANSGWISGDVGVFVDGQAGAVSITNKGIIEGRSFALKIDGAGKHTISNAGHLDGDVSLLDGINSFSNAGILDGGLETGGGADTVKNSGFVSGWVALGAGNDVFTGGVIADSVRDDAGSDKYVLGDGADVYFAVFADSGLAGDTDTVDGGANKSSAVSRGGSGDTYDASAATAGIVINLDSAIRSDILTGTLAAKASATGGGVGLDLLKGFETVLGGAHGDVLFGDKLDNQLISGGGDDALYGGAGKDRLAGGDGVDHLFGEAGADILVGGNDSAVDRFCYRALADSTVLESGRDFIKGFEDGMDIIDMSRLNLPGLLFIGVNSAFSGVGTPELRAVMASFGWLLHVDANGDRKIDMAIAVEDPGLNQIVWDPYDFDFA